MTWEELKQKAKELKEATIYISPYGDGFERIDYKGLSCCNDGLMTFAYETFAIGRTPDQMWQIMEALQ